MIRSELAEATTGEQRRTIDPDGRMERVLQAARTLFVQKGYYGVSIPMIVTSSGVSTGAIYSYFPNKEALAKAIHDRTLEQFQALFTERLVDADGPEQVLAAFARLVLELAESEPEMMEYMLFMKHGEFLCDINPICFTAPFRLLQEAIQQGMDQGQIRPSPVLVAGLSYTGVILRAAELRLMCVLDQPLTELADQLIANAWSAIRA